MKKKQSEKQLELSKFVGTSFPRGSLIKVPAPNKELIPADRVYFKVRTNGELPDAFVGELLSKEERAVAKRMSMPPYNKVAVTAERVVTLRGHSSLIWAGQSGSGEFTAVCNDFKLSLSGNMILRSRGSFCIHVSMGHLFASTQATWPKECLACVMIKREALDYLKYATVLGKSIGPAFTLVMTKELVEGEFYKEFMKVFEEEVISEFQEQGADCTVVENIQPYLYGTIQADSKTISGKKKWLLEKFERYSECRELNVRSRSTSLIDDV